MVDDEGRGGERPQARRPNAAPPPDGWGRHVEHFPLHVRFRDPANEQTFLPYFGLLKMELDIYWSMMSAMMLTLVFRVLYIENSVGGAAAIANVASLWATCAAAVYLTHRRPVIYLSLRTWLLLAIRVHRTAVFTVFISMPALRAIKWGRRFPEGSMGRILAPVAFDCMSVIAMCGFHLPGLWQAVAGSVLIFAPTVRLLRRCEPLAAAAAQATRQALHERLTGAAERAATGLLPVTLARGAPGPAPAPCTESNLALVLTMGLMFPIFLCYAIEERCRLDFAGKRGLRVVAPSVAATLVHATALLVLSGVIIWTAVEATAPWAADYFEIY